MPCDEAGYHSVPSRVVSHGSSQSLQQNTTIVLAAGNSQLPMPLISMAFSDFK